MRGEQTTSDGAGPRRPPVPFRRPRGQDPGVLPVRAPGAARLAAAALLPLLLASLALALVLASGAWYRIDDVSDVGLYLAYGARLLEGARPYRDFQVEYPPLALPLFALPALLRDPWLAARAFNLELWLLLAGAALVTVAAARRAWGGGRDWPVGLAFAAGAAALGAITVNRYDGAVTLVVALALLALAAGRTAAAAAVLGLGFALKLSPAVLLPLVLLLAPGPGAAGRAALAFAGAALVPFLPALVVAPDGVARMFGYHATRPLQIEAVPATPLLARHLLGGPPTAVASSFGSQNLASPVAQALAEACAPAALAALGLVLWLAWRRRVALKADPGAVPLAALAILLAMLVTAKVLSPQYLAWLLPAAALVLPARPRLGLLVVAAQLLTHLEFPARYWALVALRPGPVALVVARNLALLAAFALAAWHLWRLPPVAPAADPPAGAAGISRGPPPAWRARRTSRR
jgi:hypothetical protein